MYVFSEASPEPRDPATEPARIKNAVDGCLDGPVFAVDVQAPVATILEAVEPSSGCQTTVLKAGK